MTAPYVGVFDAAGRIPAGRLGSADDLGGLIVFLASKAGSYVNGASYVLDGGWLDWSVGMSRM
jgi:NAD(P)-dependent dehydrogenase (short-subunit alcohol dehydrogenase family)